MGSEFFKRITSAVSKFTATRVVVFGVILALMVGIVPSQFVAEVLAQSAPADAPSAPAASPTPSETAAPAATPSTSKQPPPATADSIVAGSLITPKSGPPVPNGLPARSDKRGVIAQDDGQAEVEQSAIPTSEKGPPLTPQGNGDPSFVPGESMELKAERRLDAKVFSNPDGTRSSKVYGSPIHYVDEKGELAELDHKIIPAAEGFKNAAGPQAISFAPSADSPELVNLKGSKHQITFSMPGARSSTPKVDGTKITYSSVADGVDLMYLVGTDSLKEMVVLHKPPDPKAETVFRFQLKTEGLTPEQAPDGGIDLADAKGEVQYRIPPATAMDSNPNPVAAAGPASLELVKEDGQWIVVLKGDAAWLATARYPVYLDPTVASFGRNRLGGGEDAFIISTSPNNHDWHEYWSPAYNRYVNFLGNVVDTFRTYGRFGIGIDFAYWYGHLLDNPYGYPTYVLRKVPATWNPETITWNNQPPLGTQTKVASGPAPVNWHVLDITDWTKGWAVNPASNHGIMMEPGLAWNGQGNTANVKAFAADNNTDGSAPFLWISYSPNQLPGVSHAVSPASGSVVNTLNPTLGVTTATDPDGDPVQYLLAVIDNADGQTKWGRGWETGLTSAQVTSGLQWGHTYTWLAYTWDGVGAAVVPPSSSWGTFTTLAPGVPGSDATGLEDFYPYQDFDLGQGTAYANMANGNLVVQELDFDIPGQGLNMRLVRTYNASAAAETVPGQFGKGWRLGVADGFASGTSSSVDLLQILNVVFPTTPMDNKTFDLTDVDGTRHHFVRDASNKWLSPPGVNLKLTDMAGNSYMVARPDGVRYVFSSSGGSKYRVTKIEDRKGNALNFIYSPDFSKLLTITDNSGRNFTVDQPADKIIKATFNAAGSSLDTTYGYDASGRLETVTEAAGKPESTSIVYHYAGADALLDKVTDARGNYTQFAIAGGKLTQITDRAGKNWTFTTGGSCVAEPGAARAICLSDPEGHSEVWSSNAGFNLVARRDEGDKDAGGATRYNKRTYTWISNRLEKAVDEAGHQTSYTWTPLGSIKTVTRPGGDNAALTTTLDYNTPDVRGWEDLNKSTTQDRIYQFFPKVDGTLDRVIDPLDKTTSFSYHALTNPARSGLLASVTDANGGVTKYGDAIAADRGYDPSGAPKVIENARTYKEFYEFDYLTRLVKTTDREEQPWINTFDFRGNLKSSEDPEHHIVRYCYNQNDRLTLVVPPRSGQTPSCSASGTDTALNGEDGYSTKISYDARDLVTEQKTKSDSTSENAEAGLQKTEFKYFDDAQLKEVWEPKSFDKVSGAAGTAQKTTRVLYDNNRLKQSTGASGAVTTARYDARGLPEFVTYPETSGAQRPTAAYAYNHMGQVSSALQSGHSQPATSEYNAFGDLIKTITPEGHTKSYSTTYVPDKLGRTVTVTEPPARAQGDPEAQAWQKLPTVMEYGFDGVGNLKTVKQPTGTGGNTEVRYTFWPTNQLKTETDPFDDPSTPHHVTEYDYDKVGRQKLRRDLFDGTEQRKTVWDYFADGTLRFETSTGGGLATHRSGFVYNLDNNLTAVKTADNVQDPVIANISAIVAGYTTQGELEKVDETIYPPGGGAAVTKTSSFDWLRDGVIDSHTIDGQTSTFEHRLDRMESKFTPFGAQGEFTSSWFDNGDLNRLTMPNGSVITQLYDPAARLRSRMVEAGSVTQSSWTDLEYDDNDNRLSEQTSQLQPDGAGLPNQSGTANYGYDQLDRLIRFGHPFDDNGAAVSYLLDPWPDTSSLLRTLRLGHPVP